MSTKKNNINTLNKYFMNLAFLQAKRCLGNTSNNPSVGCLITNKNNEVISIGKTGISGRPHAEINAIKNTKINLNGLNVYITLEPCTHFGKTSPCTNKIISSGLKKLYYSVDDIDIRTSKKAKKILNKKKINVHKGLLFKEINNFYKYYYKNKIKFTA